MTIEETLKATVDECLKGAVKIEPTAQTAHPQLVSESPKTRIVHPRAVSDAENEDRAKWGWQRKLHY
jgi:hypothetical protein